MAARPLGKLYLMPEQFRVCTKSGCPELTDRKSGYCDRHEAVRRKAQDAQRGNWRQRGYDQEYDRNHAVVLREEAHCHVCGQLVDKTLPGTHRDGPSVDHLVRRADGGSNARPNLRLAHLRCNSGRRTTVAPAPRRARSEATAPFVVIVGQPGTGKTAIRDILAERIGALAMGPDDYQGDWNLVYDRLDTSPNAIVECCALPRALRRKAARRGAHIIHLTASPDARRQRLLDRGEPDGMVRRWLEEADQPIGYEDHITPNQTIDTTTLSPQQATDKIAAALPAPQRASHHSLGLR